MRFKQFLTEAIADRNFEKEIDEWMTVGEIVKPRFEDLKRALDRAIYNDARELSKEHVYGKGSELDSVGLGDLVYDIPDGSHAMVTFKKKMDKFKTEQREHPVMKAVSAFVDKYIVAATKLKELKSKVVTTTAKRAEAKEVKAQEFKKKFADASSLINELMKNIDEYVERAGEMAQKQVDEAITRLKKADWDLESFAPSPKNTDSTATYRHKAAVRAYYSRLTESHPSDRNKRKRSLKNEKAFVELNKQAAKDSYIEWTHKMIQKIGKPVTKASSKGSPWSGSVLTVITNDGEEQVWDTKMIINRSKYDLLFNQFPSRRKK